jgi:multisubunit Na+/H+ antiporter MnhG subunit
MTAVGGMFVLVALVGLAAPLVLYYLVRAEHDQREEMDRQSAERAARRDTRDRE